MEIIITGILAYIGGLATAVAAMQRAARKPNGKTAKVMNLMSGGGGGNPKEPL
jgi:hypothetical protein